ncbi:MAG: hypothetical protein QOI20_1545 [Acidimicrobiaceae bacterium]|jgi:hypothetical protein|nr:hypothetical protein [Acidimicrobiaceae bacterium]
MPAWQVPWETMTPDQREFCVYLYASQYMVDVMKWNAVPDDMAAKLRELDARGVWADYIGDSGKENDTAAPS